MSQASDQKKGIGGWLIVVALIVIVTPFIQLASLLEIAQGYSARTATSGQTTSALNALIYLEISGAGFFSTWACFNVYLFLKKKTKLIKSFVAFLIINWLFVVADLFAAQTLADLPITSDEFIQTARHLVAVLIWSSYMNRSNRVKNTFVLGNQSWKVQVSTLILGGVASLVGIFLFAKFAPVPVITEEMLKAEARGVAESVVGEGIRLDGADAAGMIFTFNYTLMDGTADEWDTNEITAFFHSSALELACFGLVDWLDAGVTVRYQYSGSDGLPVATLDFKDGDCPEVD